MKTLIWDFDGTLGYREGGGFSTSLFQVAQQAGLDNEVRREQLRPYLQHGFPWHTPERPHLEIETAEQWWERLYPAFERAFVGMGFDASRARSLARETRAAYTRLDRWRLFDDVLATLDLLAASGWRHLILSNHVPELGDIVRHLGLDTHVAQVINSAEIGYEKPHPRAFEIVRDRFPDAEAFWMIGDNMGADIEGTASVGIPGILVRRYDEGAERCCESLSGVPRIVEGAA